MSNAKLTPDYLFEVSWEVCNKVGGIHTVISTKAQTVTRKFADRYILIGPDLQHEGANPEFEEDPDMLKAWRQSVYSDGLRIRVGHWKIKGEPTVILVDFTSLIPRKDEILKKLWETYHVDSLSGQWDYIEPVLFGYAAGMVIASYVDNFCNATDKIAAHFHEWMTAAGGLHLRKHAPYVATLFTTHATVMGRCIAGNGLPLYNDLAKFNADELARQFNVVAKHSVSDITANECKYLLGREPDGITPNGFENDFVWTGEEYDAKRAEARTAMISVAEACLGHKFRKEPLIVGTSGRYEFRNKGLDVFIESLKKLAASDRLKREVLAYVTVPAANRGPRADLQAHLADPASPIDGGQYKYSTHYLEYQNSDPIVNALNGSILTTDDSKVKVIFVPTYLNKADGIFNKDYYELLVGMDITVFPSYYEPWGYTPLESVAFSVPTITTTLAGFGLWVDKQREHLGVEVIRPDLAGLMGAYGAALFGLRQSHKNHQETSAMMNLAELESFDQKVVSVKCGGCGNHCQLTINTFADGRKFISGNRCDKPVTGKSEDDSLNLYAYKQQLLAGYKPVPGKRGSIGIPLCLNMYELLPFWYTFWTRLGFAVHTSPVSSRGLYLAGQATIPSDTACFPAKLSHGHIKALSQMHLDAIFYPCLTYNVDEGLGDNHYNCPVVAYYPEVLAGNCPELEGQKFIYDYVGIHRPKDFVRKMAKEVLPKYFGGISEKEVQAAADAAYAEHEAHMAQIRVKGSEIIDEARRQGKRIIVLAGRPYHVDPEINHGIDHLITRHGAAVVTEDSISNRVEKFPTSVLNQWTYHSRLYAAAKYCTTQKDMDLVQLVSFGCGVDAITTDETREILQAGSKLYTQLKIDEITNLGAVNIRLRSLFAALEERDEAAEEKAAPKAEA